MTPRSRMTSTGYSYMAEDSHYFGGEKPSYYAVATHIHNFSEIKGKVSDAQVPNDITINHASTADEADRAKKIRALPSAPSNPSSGEVYFNTAQKMAYIYDGSQWNEYRGPKGDTGAQGPQGPQGSQGPAGPSKLPYYACVQDIPSSAPLGQIIVCGANSKYSSSPYHCNGVAMNTCPGDGDGPYADNILVYLEKYYPHLGGYVTGWWCVH